MTVAEAHRQWQAALERQRAVEARTEGLTSFETERREATEDAEKARAVMFAKWITER